MHIQSIVLNGFSQSIQGVTSNKTRKSPIVQVTKPICEHVNENIKSDDELQPELIRHKGIFSRTVTSRCFQAETNKTAIKKRATIT